MAKKVEKTPKNNVTNNVNNEEVKTVTEDKNKVSKKEEKLANVENRFSELNIVDLMTLERACALICSKHEMAARIDKTNNDKFKEYKTYYEDIFREIERRVSKMCKS